MAVGEPFDDPLLGAGDNLVRRFTIERVAGDAGLLGAAGGFEGAVVADVYVAILGKVGMKGDVVGDSIEGHERLETIRVGSVLRADQCRLSVRLRLSNQQQAIAA